MAKIIVTGTGSAQSNSVIRCLKMDEEPNEIIGLGSDKYDLMLSPADRKILIPYSTDPHYRECLLSVLREEKADMIHFQHDKELLVASAFREEIADSGIQMFIPDHETIEICVHKYKTWEKFRDAGMKVPRNMIIHTQEDLRHSFEEFGSTIWLRSMAVGGGGLGSLAAHSFGEACEWIEKAKGWGTFLAAELLNGKTVTWQSIWDHGELIVAQGRRRHSWAFGALSASGVTGITRVCETISDKTVDEVGMAACRAVCDAPHGVFGVDMTYDFTGFPNPTEINIGRFFTTVRFFAEAGLNLPVIIKDICLYGKKPKLKEVLNPLPDHLLWIRGMDEQPRLTTEKEIETTLLRRNNEKEL